MKKYAFIITHLNIGGPSKSLIALLDRMDLDKTKVDIYVINKNKVYLKDYFPKKVNIIYMDQIYYFLTMPKGDVFRTLKFFLKYNFRMFVFVLKLYILIFVEKISPTIARQKLIYHWHKRFGGNEVKISTIEYDKSFGILGNSSYLLHNLNSKKMYHWVRGDYRIMKRDVNIDNEYYKNIGNAIAVSKEVKNIFSEFFPEVNTRVIYNPMQTKLYDRVSFDEDIYKSIKKYKSMGYKIIISISRLDPLKGINLMLDTCERLKNNDKMKFKWILMGDGDSDMINWLNNEITKRNLYDCLIPIGFHLNTKVFLELSDLFVLLSKTEGKSNAVDEAKFYGIPVLVTEYPTVKDQVEDMKTGVICDYKIDDIVKKIKLILEDDSLRKKLIKNTIGIEDFDMDVKEGLKKYL